MCIPNFIRDQLICIVLVYLSIQANSLVARVLQSHFANECEFDTLISQRSPTLACLLVGFHHKIDIVLTQTAHCVIVIFATYFEPIYVLACNLASKLPW
jgi:hypothetical protein